MDFMSTIGGLYKQADWKSEKHVPVIDCPSQTGADGVVEVKLCVGKEIAHPNTTEHHIRWIRLYFQPQGGPAPYEVASLEFNAHGESTGGANAGPAYTQHQGSVSLKLSQPGTLIATSYCNIHGLWESSKEIKAG
jgi:superoxide reductase